MPLSKYLDVYLAAPTRMSVVKQSMDFELSILSTNILPEVQLSYMLNSLTSIVPRSVQWLEQLSTLFIIYCSTISFEGHFEGHFTSKRIVPNHKSNHRFSKLTPSYLFHFTCSSLGLRKCQKSCYSDIHKVNLNHRLLTQLQ